MGIPGFSVEKPLQMTDNTYIRGASEPEKVNRESWRTSVFVVGLLVYWFMRVYRWLFRLAVWHL